MSAPVCRSCQALRWQVGSDEIDLRRVAARAARNPIDRNVRMVEAVKSRLAKSRTHRDYHLETCEVAS